MIARGQVVTACSPFLILVVCAACSLAPAPKFSEPALDAVSELPDSFSQSAVTDAHEPAQWWRAFADPTLDSVIEAALASNFDMAEAIARVEQARVRARLAGAGRFPTAEVKAGVVKFDLPVDASVSEELEKLGFEDAINELSDSFTQPERLGLTTYTLSAEVAYEFDVWGRIRHGRLAAGAELLASESDLQAIHISVLSETISAYFDIANLRRQTALAAESVAVLQEREQLLSVRYDRGLTDSLMLYQVRQVLYKVQADLPGLDNRLADAEERLAILIGGYRADIAELLPPGQLSPAPVAAPVPTGIPVDLLLQRPDVRAAKHRLDAAGHDIRARRAEMLPVLSFSGSLGLQSTDFGDLFDVEQWFGNLLGNLLTPVFDGGRLKRNVMLAQARFNELAAAYGRTVVTAVNEVETALVELRNQGQRHAFLSRQGEEAQASLDLESQRYAAGVGDYADFLDATLMLLRVKVALAGSERNLALARLAVHRALGGAWTPAAQDQPPL